jgi:hypothetical protein
MPHPRRGLTVLGARGRGSYRSTWTTQDFRPCRWAAHASSASIHDCWVNQTVFRPLMPQRFLQRPNAASTFQ